MDKKAPTTAHLSKLEDVLGDINGIEKEVAQIVETLPATNNTILNGKIPALKKAGNLSELFHNDTSMDIKSLRDKFVVIYGLDGVGIDVAECLCSMGVNNLIVLGKGIIKREDFVEIGYIDGYENWTRARKAVDHLINVNPSANIEGCNLSVETEGGVTILKYALKHRTLFTFAEKSMSSNETSFGQREEIYRCYHTGGNRPKAMDPLEGADVPSSYRKVTTKTYVGHRNFLQKSGVGEDDSSHKNCADVLIASVSNRAEALVLNDICIDLGIKLIISWSSMLEGHISVMRPFNSPCFRCSNLYTEDIPERRAESCTAFPSIQYLISGAIVNNFLQIFLNSKPRQKSTLLEQFSYSFETLKLTVREYGEKNPQCTNALCATFGRSKNASQQ
eukprot:g11534.t1